MAALAFQKKYRPFLNGTKCTWRLPNEFRENEGLLVLGVLQNIFLEGKATTCAVDLREVQWADPQPLLCLGLILAESRLPKKSIAVNLGSSDEKTSEPAHRIFLKFFAQQGFLNAISEFANFYLENKLYSSASEIQGLRVRLSAESQGTHFQNANCIFASILRVDEQQSDDSALRDKVEVLVREAQIRAVGSAFGAEPLVRDMLFQKLRKLLFELMLNIAEHSHADGVPAFAGLYARVRGAKPQLEDDAKTWDELFANGRSIHGQTEFNPNPYAEWLELFVCDVGVGLVARIREWTEPPDKEVANDLKRAKAALNPLEAIAYRLFRNALSRHSRHDTNRTAVTGLQHLGHILTVDGDYCRLYTQNGTWVGGHLPWQRGYSRKDLRIGFRDAKSENLLAGLVPLSGTVYSFSIQPKHRSLSDTASPWVTPCEHCRKGILDVLRDHALYTPLVPTAVFDRRTANDCSPPDVSDISKSTPAVIVLRPPRFMSKQDLAKWLLLVAGRSDRPTTSPTKIFILTDLSPFQMSALHELLLHISIHPQSELDLYLVSEQWAVCCLNTIRESSRFISLRDKADQFLHASFRRAQFSIGHLAIIMRQMDSELFWSTDANHAFEPFFNHPVDWSVGSPNVGSIRLQRYLDFAHALADPMRYRACRRALRRCLALFPGYAVEGADDLVSSLVKDIVANGQPARSDQETHMVVVGSVAVTANTVEQRAQRYGCQSIHMLEHGDSNHTKQRHLLCALLWMPKPHDGDGDFSATHPAIDLSKVPWRRIPNSSYIAPRGEQSISILRYRRDQDGCLDFTNPLYGRTPADMYRDFCRLGVLKTGHWKYGTHHDLVTVNTGLAFKYSILELGPLYDWLKREFRALFGKPADGQVAQAQILVYPSHPVTDAMFDRIRQDLGFADIVPVGGMIPVKFLGLPTVSPLMASHLVAQQIEERVRLLDLSEWSAVVVDDGVVSGKHMRELTQFLQALDAKVVFTLALLDRTGLPAQEAVLKRFFARHKRYWRWDVPSLGNRRDCPLCQGLAIAQTIAPKLSSSRQVQRLQQWVELWRARDVETDWHHGGLVPTPFSPALDVTFGVDEREDGTRVETSVQLDTSTSAASILLELTRLTTRADITLRKARMLAATYTDGAIEIIATQVLLFLDELTIAQKIERFKLLLDLIWSRQTTTPAMSLAGLCFTLADREVVEVIWSDCITNLLPKRHIGNLDAILATNILRSRFSFQTKSQYQLQANVGDVERLNYVMLGGTDGLRRHIRNFLDIYRNPNLSDCMSAHTTVIRGRLDTVVSSAEGEATSMLVLRELPNLLRDVRLVEQILMSLRGELVVRVHDSDLDSLGKLLRALESSLALSHESDNAAMIANQIIMTASSLQLVLYGDMSTNGLLGKLADQLFKHFDNIDRFDNELIGRIIREVTRRWADIVDVKKENSRLGDRARRRWRAEDGELSFPSICRSERTDIPGLWLYCDSFVQKAIEEALSNVYHATRTITDPWMKRAGEVDVDDKSKSHLWWKASVDGDYMELETCNASANRTVSLKQTVNIAALERVGGSISVTVTEHPIEGPLAYTKLRVPLHSAFIKENLA